MGNHNFVFSEYSGNRKIYIVKCLETGGEFSTVLWIDGKAKQNVCPCCKEQVNTTLLHQRVLIEIKKLF